MHIKRCMFVRLYPCIIKHGLMFKFSAVDFKLPQNGTLAKNVAPDQTPQNEASDQGLHCLHLMQEFLKKIW